MKDFDKYKQRAQRIAAAAESAGNGLGMTIAWLMIVVGADGAVTKGGKR